MSHSPAHPPRIAVVGAGIAGLACARVLTASGLDVHVFEKSRGVAGRMSTRRGEHGQCDHGAQYFTARDPAFRAEVQRWIAAGAAALWTPRLYVFDSEEAAGRLQAASVERFVGTPGMTAPGRLLAEGLQVHVECQISHVQRFADHWQLQDTRGMQMSGFDAVLLAMPAPQAWALLQDVAPVLATRATSVPMRPSWALMLHYDSPLPLPFDAAFVNAGPLRWIARDGSKPGRPDHNVWLLHGTAQWSTLHLDASHDAVADMMLAAGHRVTGCDLRHGLRARTLHRWLYADTEHTLGEPCLWNAESALGLCGDWLQDDKIEGAWCSGRALAQQVLGTLHTFVGARGSEDAGSGAVPQCRRIALGSVLHEQSLQLRERVLRAPLGLRLSETDLRGEEAQWHFALSDDQEALQACVLAVPLGEGAFKLRQMAVRPDLQGQGLGRTLLLAVEALLLAEGARSIVLHARVSAATFYQKLGYEVQGEDFEEVGIPHRKMSKRLV